MSPRNEFEQNVPVDEEETYEVPLKMGVGGPVIGTAKVTKDGVVKDTMITSDAVKKYITPGPSSFSIQDPADRYRVNPPEDITVENADRRFGYRDLSGQ